MGRRWLSVEGISAPEEPQYWMQNNVETCSTIEISCEFVGSLIPWSLPTVTLLYYNGRKVGGDQEGGNKTTCESGQKIVVAKKTSCTFAVCWRPHAGSPSGTSAAEQGGRLLPWQHERVPNGDQKCWHTQCKWSALPGPS